MGADDLFVERRETRPRSRLDDLPQAAALVQGFRELMVCRRGVRCLVRHLAGSDSGCGKSNEDVRNRRSGIAFTFVPR